MDICFFEDPKKKNFHPLVYLRNVEDLRCGVLTIKEKWAVSLDNAKLPFVVFINSRALPDAGLTASVKKFKEEALLVQKDEIVAALLSKERAKKIRSSEDLGSLGIKKITVNAELLDYPWELVHRNAEEIKKDIALLKPKKTAKKGVYLGKSCKIKPGVVLDADDGPIFIDDGAKILANSVIMGPCYIGKGTMIKAVAKIYGGTSIGPMCKVGGEVEGSIFQGYSNKQHDGFLGHSYICEWVNLGADTNNSDLKNNYGNVKVYVDGKIVDTGHQFVGLFMGDHSKAGINTMFNTGTVVGVSSNVFGADFPPKFVPSFSWGGAGKMIEYDIEKAVETAKAVMKRRDIKMTKEYETLLRKIFMETAPERSLFK